mgnify:CR=1 FL=1
MASLKGTLLQRTRSAIRAYNVQRARLVKEAAESGGAEAAAVLEEEFDALCNAVFALQRASLKRNHRRYGRLLAEATEGVTRARELIQDAASASTVLDGLAKAVTLVGRALLLLGG